MSNLLNNRHSYWTPEPPAPVKHVKKAPRPRFGEVRGWPESHEYRNQQHPLCVRASQLVDKAISMGIIEDGDQCQCCGGYWRIVAHHECYLLPLMVVWICRECHGKRHWNVRYDWDHSSARLPDVSVLLSQCMPNVIYPERLHEVTIRKNQMSKIWVSPMFSRFGL